MGRGIRIDSFEWSQIVKMSLSHVNICQRMKPEEEDFYIQAD